MKDIEADIERMHTPDTKTDETIVKPMMPSDKIQYMFLNMIAFSSAATMSACNIPGWVVKKYDVDHELVIRISTMMALPYGICVMLIHIRWRGMPNRLVGHYGRAAIDIITLCAAVMLHVFFPYDGSDSKKRALGILVSLTIQLYCWGQGLHLTWDICFHDMLLHALMEVVTYLSRGLTCIMLLLLFFGVISYRFFSYSAPSTPESIKKDLGSSVC